MRRSHQYQNNQPASTASLSHTRNRNLHEALKRPLDRVNVLGDDLHGHTGCVNALSWARDGELLLSGGDDTTVRIWAIDTSDTSQDYPYKCRAVIQTGHRANIFSNHMLPFSSRIATVAGDHQVRVFDIGEDGLAGSPNGEEMAYSSRQSCIGVLRCHNDRVKRIVTEHSPDLFLSVSEDGSVRQYDLRTPHNCRLGRCPPPLLQTKHDLSTATLSPLTPHLLVVAGHSPYGYLYDRRNIGRSLADEWGVVPKPDDRDALTHCVRRFGRPKGRQTTSFVADHITGARMSTDNGHEVLLNYSGDAVYLFSTTDDPMTDDSMASASSSRLSPNSSEAKVNKVSPGSLKNSTPPSPRAVADEDTAMDDNDDEGPEIELDNEVVDTLAQFLTEAARDNPDVRDEEEEDDMDDEDETDQSKYHPDIPVVMPRHVYSGIRNLATVKDVNFLGPNDEFVTSGSDDGNFFIWNKVDKSLQGIYEGDSSVVNMVEGHPTLPLIAVSGIDYTVKLFAPTSGSSLFSRLQRAQKIMSNNARPGHAVGIRYSFATLIAEARQAMAAGEEVPDCRAQ